MNWRLLTGDVRDSLRTLPADSARTCVTSPPYWGLRDYGVEGQLGLEPTPDAYVAAMVEVFREVRRVLAEDGTLWLNLGDSYAGGGGFAPDAPCNVERRERIASGDANSQTFKLSSRQHERNKSGGIRPQGDIKAKDLVGIPWMVAFALRADGWYLRSDIIWSKPNPMPESVTDRPTKAHEYLFLLSKAQTYYYDAAAIAEGISDVSLQRINQSTFAAQKGGPKDYGTTGVNVNRSMRQTLENFAENNTGTRNKRSVWTIATQPYPDAHFATFPEALIEPCILAGSALEDTILDPFTGSGTTGAVAIRHQRSFVGCELNPVYVELARQRIGAVAPLLAQEVA